MGRRVDGRPDAAFAGSIPRDAWLLAFSATAVAAGPLLGYAGWPHAQRSIELAGSTAAAILTAWLAARQGAADEGAAMHPSFVIEFAALLLLGSHAAVLVAVSGIVAQQLSAPASARSLRASASQAAGTVAAMQAAGLVHGALGGTLGHFVWPLQAVPIAVAAATYCLVKVAAAEVAAPLLSRQPFNRSWPSVVGRECPLYFVGAGVAVGIAEIVDRRMWDVLPVAAVPLFFACRSYCESLHRCDDERRGREVLDSLDQGMAVVDGGGRVTLWNDALARILGCPRDRAIGRSLASAVPALANTELPRTVQDALVARTPRALAHVGLALTAGVRILQVKILPVASGATLLWNDVTDRVLAEQALKRTEERLLLAAEGANDGLWEWDLRTQEFYASSRWKSMVGLPAAGGIGRPEEWFVRIHEEDLLGVKEALQAHLAGKADYFEQEHRIRHEDGTFRRFLCRGVALRGPGGRPVRLAGSLTDTTDRAAADERLLTAGFLDSLTGLRNRADFVEGLGRRLEEFKQRRGNGRFAVLYLDLDRFKVVNDSLGHLVGDELLIAVSRRLESCLRQGDSLARLGGDEFAILLNGLNDDQQANAIAMRIQETLSEPFSIAGREVFTSASIGIAPGQAHYVTPDEIMRDADTAMYHAKARGKARHEIFDADMHARVRDRLGLENDLRHAVTSHDFEVHYQPIVSLASGMCVGFESLIRWRRNGEPVSPATFVPMAEELGLIEPLGTWVLREACRTFADWKRRFPDLECITVNASSRQLMQQNFLQIVEQAVHEARLRPSDLRIEITETALLDSPHLAAEVLRQLRDFGVKIYLDDFGTGYSSLSHLHKLPVDALKIDRSFVKSLLLPDRPAIVESILALARTLNTSVVAEGIETDVQARELERLGCTHAQGFLFSRPLSTQSAEQLLIENQPLGPKHPDSVAARAGGSNEPELYYSAPFEWPESMAPRGATTPEPLPRLMGALNDPPRP
jgi:diguanylate cyclase (GGDEF)-like protein/PAS domain S-box-containing protein